MKITKFLLVTIAVLVGKAAHPQLHEDVSLPPSPCDSDYRSVAREKFGKLLDVTDEVVPEVSAERITEFE